MGTNRSGALNAILADVERIIGIAKELGIPDTMDFLHALRMDLLTKVHGISDAELCRLTEQIEEGMGLRSRLPEPVAAARRRVRAHRALQTERIGREAVTRAPYG
jgi:hypothetical protein